MEHVMDDWHDDCCLVDTTSSGRLYDEVSHSLMSQTKAKMYSMLIATLRMSVSTIL